MSTENPGRRPPGSPHGPRRSAGEQLVAAGPLAGATREVGHARACDGGAAA